MLNIFYLLLWPIIRRVLLKRISEYGAGHVADYFNRRRARRLGLEEEPGQISAVGREKCPPCPPSHIGYAPTDVFWFTLSGVFLGSALGVLLSYLVRQEE